MGRPFEKLNLAVNPIHPASSNARAFLAEHFTPNPRKLLDIVKAGYRAGRSTLSNYEFEY